MTKEIKILTIANRKGGAGKSTCAAHIALEAVKKGLKVLLIDLDPQATLEMWWKKREETNPQLADIDSSNIKEMLININKHGFDLCIIDTPGDTSNNSINGIKVADIVLVPSKPTAPDLSAVGRTINMITKEEKPFLFLITQAIPKGKAAIEAMGILSKFGEVAPVTLSNRTSYANAMSAGTSASQVDKSAQEELESLWNFLYRKLFNNINTVEGNEKTKIQLG